MGASDSHGCSFHYRVSESEKLQLRNMNDFVKDLSSVHLFIYLSADTPAFLNGPTSSSCAFTPSDQATTCAYVNNACNESALKQNASINSLLCDPSRMSPHYEGNKASLVFCFCFFAPNTVYTPLTLQETLECCERVGGYRLTRPLLFPPLSALQNGEEGGKPAGDERWQRSQ